MGDFSLDRFSSVLVVIDVQERLTAAMDQREKVVENCRRLIEGSRILGVPVVVTEQYPRGLGPTEEALRGALSDHPAVEKISFSCCGEEAFVKRLQGFDRNRIIVAGMETHVCVLQTVLDLLDQGHRVHLARDAVCSRDRDNWLTGVEMMRDAGAVISSTETVLFQLLGKAGTADFKAVSKLVK